MAPTDTELTHPSSPTKHLSEETLGLQVQEFLVNWEFRIMCSSFGKKWKREKAVASALELLACNGVPLETEEIELISKADEQIAVTLVTDKIPYTLYDNFEILANQLQVMLNTMCRVRGAVDDNTEVERVFEEQVESDSLVQRVLKEAVLTASNEAADLHKRTASWMDSMEKRLDRLTRSAEYAEYATQQLMAVESQLANFKGDAKASGKKALMGMADKNEKALTQSVWTGWLGITLANKADREIRAKYEAELHAAEKELFAYKEKQLQGVKDVLMRKVREGDRGLVDCCISSWYDVVQQTKKDGDTKAELEKMQARMKDFKDDAKARQMKVMGRMSEGNDQAAVVLAWNSWTAFHQDYQKDKETEEAAKKLEQQLAAQMKDKKDEAKKVLDRMAGATDTGLMQTCWRAWLQSNEEDRKAKQLADEMAKTDVRLKQMIDQQKGNAFGVQARTNEQMKENLCLKVFCAWTLETKVAHVEKYYENKMTNKRGQLKKVQTLFKSFAQQLEEGLNNVDGGDSSGRTHTRRSKVMNKGDGTVSLPDIHAKTSVAA
jgi:hypothetical protein